MDEQSYSSNFDEPSLALTLHGEIDEASGVALRDEISKYSQDFHRRISVDVGDVDYFPSLAVGVLATARKKADEAGVGLGIVAKEGSIAQRVLTICGLEHETA